MVSYLDKTDGNAEFHEIIDFLTRSLILYDLIVSSIVSTTFVEQSWMTAKSKTINNVRYITATVARKHVSISEASIRSDLQFNDAAGIDVLPNQAIFDTIQLMGYEGDLNTLTFNKGLFSPQWKFLFHTIIHCLSSKSTSWDQIPNNIATAVICLATNQVYNFSKLVFDGMMNHLDAKEEVCHVPTGKNIYGNVTPLFPSMLAQPTEDEGAVSERPSETQPKPSPTHPSSGGNHKGQSSSDRSLSGNEDGLTLQSVRRKPSKSEPTMHKDPAFDDHDDAMDYMETEDAHDEGIVKENEETRVSTEDQFKDTDRPRTKTERSILTLKPLLKIDPKDKGKKVLKEKAESNAESKEEEKKKLAEEEAIMAAFTTKFLHDTIAAQRRFLAQQRSELSKITSYKKSAEKPNAINITLKYVKAKIEEPKENIKKRSGRRLKMKAPKRSKRQNIDSDHEEENQLRTFLKIVPEEKEKINYEVLGTRVRAEWRMIHGDQDLF
ncbi:hypothetical protein Tco_1245633 [Tanacetum coccineum]